MRALFLVSMVAYKGMWKNKLLFYKKSSGRASNSGLKTTSSFTALAPCEIF